MQQQKEWGTLNDPSMGEQHLEVLNIVCCLLWDPLRARQIPGLQSLELVPVPSGPLAMIDLGTCNPYYAGMCFDLILLALVLPAKDPLVLLGF